MTAEQYSDKPQPYWIGRRIAVLPEGADPIAGRLPVWIRPGGAFGTGGHPTTRLCLRALERHVEPGARVLDVGTGTGILAIAAASLGAGWVLAVDTDMPSVDAARENVRLNGMTERIKILPGSIGAALEETGQSGKVSLAVVNIPIGIVPALLSEGLAAAVAPGGLLSVSGLLASQSPILRADLPARGFNFLGQEREGEWAGILARRSPD